MGKNRGASTGLEFANVNGLEDKAVQNMTESFKNNKTITLNGKTYDVRKDGDADAALDETLKMLGNIMTPDQMKRVQQMQQKMIAKANSAATAAAAQQTEPIIVPKNMPNSDR